MTREEPDADRIDRTSTADQLASIVRARILNGTLAPGTPIREVTLAESLGVSRNTVREGVRLLLGEGLLEHRPHKGVAVATVDATDIVEIYGARRLLELKAVRGAPRTPWPRAWWRSKPRSTTWKRGPAPTT